MRVLCTVQCAFCAQYSVRFVHSTVCISRVVVVRPCVVECGFAHFRHILVIKVCWYYHHYNVTYIIFLFLRKL